MNFKKLVASSLVCATLVGSIGLPNYVLNQDVFASTISLNYAADAAGIDGIKAFVTRMYDVCLGRKPDEQGLNGWTNQLVNKEATGCSVAFGFVFSPEFVGKNPSNKDFVNYMYAAFFGREADQGGLNYWVDFLNKGASKEEVFAGFANSQEFSNLCKKYNVVKGYYVQGQNANNTAKVNLFVDRLYSIILNRECDEGGMAGWTEKLLKNEQTGCSVAYGFVFSPEFLNRHACNNCYVEALYKAFLGRASDEGGKKAWVDKLNQGSTRESVFSGFAGSAEFAAICSDYGIQPGNLNGVNGSTYADGEKCTICGGSSNGGSTGGGSTGGGTNPTTAPVTSDKDGLVEINGDWYYYERGKMCHGFVQVKDDSGKVSTYYFDDTTGKAFKGWHEIEGKKYYFLDSGVAATGFCEINGHTYYFDPVFGVMASNIRRIEDGDNLYTYYFDPDTGIMQTGWLTTEVEVGTEVVRTTYYFLPSGKAAIDFEKIDGKLYHFSSIGSLTYGWFYVNNYEDKCYSDENGVVQVGWVKLKQTYSDKEEWYYFDENGIMLTDWQKIGDKWYYFSSIGAMCTDWRTIDGKEYYFGTNGVMRTGWQKITRNNSTNYYYFGTNGVKHEKGWEKINNKWYYFDIYGRMATGWRQIDGKYYWFGGEEDGAMKSSKWVEITDSKGTKFWSYFTADGSAYTDGIYKIDGKWYYFTFQGVLVQKNFNYNGKYYTVDSDGAITNYNS